MDCAGVVNENINGAEEPRRLLHRGVRLLFVAHVQRQWRRPPPASTSAVVAKIVPGDAGRGLLSWLLWRCWRGPDCPQRDRVAFALRAPVVNNVLPFNEVM